MTRLRRSDPTRPGYTRKRAGTGFSYRDPAGQKVTETVLRERFAALAIPPAWSDVWISPHANGHIQAIGIDAAGRRQYIYHPVWREQKDRLKFERALQLAESLPRVRGQVTRELRGDGPPRTRALAAAFRMLDLASLRIGSERYADTYGSHGLSTLLCSHVTVRGDVVRLNFPAKSGQQFQGVITDADLALYLRARLRERPAAPLLSWVLDDIEDIVSAADINDFIKERTGGEFTAKDFRTLRGTAAAAQSLAASLAESLKVTSEAGGRPAVSGVAGSAGRPRSSGGTDGAGAAGAPGAPGAQASAAGPAGSAAPAASAARPPRAATRSRRQDNRVIAAAMRQAADALGNTPAIARTSYVDPRVVDLYLAGETIDPAGRVSVETALRTLLLGEAT
ncbi:DNA topoisomerase IB [Cryobacterium flavum]|uniref:DNA topoisomerase n=1 Tax=Cryobacterium flavum TaxID=1424659 RepID=A0A4R8V4M1_9MICO|nr:DNA topoisomerase IB [Cryobacterium flavum]TFB77142.1 DNA topoisomerase IB [Cryobacterium flavum]SDN38207.1 DNA topoisomerase IB [Cryobacterium flavum]